ncbi:MAG: methyltransferase domain-containing protein [Firmicutes bacterium]|nr:methyltransferase domain-containing protein [Bacillota bacterium]
MKQLLAHLAACTVLQQFQVEIASPEQVLALVDGNYSALPPVVAGQAAAALTPFDSQGDLACAEIALAMWQKGPKNLGGQYQALRDREHKKRLGQVFTPPATVEAVLDLAPGSLKPKSICDPACGAGDFLLSAARRWPEANLSGTDLDPLALAVAASRLALHGFSADLTVADALKLPVDKPGWEASVDLVVGNPPWGGKVLRPQGFDIEAATRANACTWFIELAHWLLKKDGELLFLLPEALLKVHGFAGAREWFIDRFALRRLIYMPNVFSGYYAPAVALEATKGGIQEKVTVGYSGRSGEPIRTYNILPATACRRERININYDSHLEQIWLRCSNGAVFLQEGDLGRDLPAGEAVVDFSLGIVTGDNRRFVTAERQTAAQLPLLTAADVRRFAIAPARNWLAYDPKVLQQVAPLKKYQAPAKLIYKFISRELVCAVDRSGALVLNSLNIALPLRLPFSLDYLAALLNSRLLNTLYMYRFFTGKVLTRNLKQLPLKIPAPPEEEALLAKVRAGKLAEADDFVEELYCLSEAEKKHLALMRDQLQTVFFV